MKLLLDECVTRFLKRALPNHDVQTVAEAGFRGLKNGALLMAASASYDALITVDRNLEYQQNIRALEIAVVILAAAGTTYEDLLPLVPKLEASLKNVRPGEMTTIT